MSVGIISLLALGALIFLSQKENINIGVLALAAAWLIGFFLAELEISEIASAFPLSLFLVLLGVTLFFNLVRLSGTLDLMTRRVLMLVKGRVFLLPIIFFILTAVLSALGVGNIGSVALIAPIALSVAAKTGISAFLMSVMVITGANAGAFSPFAFTGVIANNLIAKQGVSLDPWMQIFFPSSFVQSFIGLMSYLIFGFALWKNGWHKVFEMKDVIKSQGEISRFQKVTLVSMGVFVYGVIIFHWDVGFLGFCLAGVLSLFNVVDSQKAVKELPWNVILLVCGMSTLIGIVELTGGLDLVIDWLARISTAQNVTGILAFVVGVVSTFSSSSGVVMPTFIPMVPGLIEKIGGGNAGDLIVSINVGSHVVDVSPLSTLGALCLAQVSVLENKSRLFRNLLCYGLSMSIVGGLVCFIFLGVL
jgi:Na+/H+ antiporter NhaD/arsenite permease-like protein